MTNLQDSVVEGIKTSPLNTTTCDDLIKSARTNYDKQTADSIATTRNNNALNINMSERL